MSTTLDRHSLGQNAKYPSLYSLSSSFCFTQLALAGYYVATLYYMVSQSEDRLFICYSDLLASFPGTEEGEERTPGTHALFAYARNYSKSHVVELGACTNMTINGSREQHKPS